MIKWIRRRKKETGVQSLTKHQFEESFVKKLNWKCTQRDNSSCVMLKWLAYMNRLFKKSSLEFGQIEITQSSDVPAKDDQFDDMSLARAARTDDEALSYIIADKLWSFARSRTLRYKMFDDADVVVASEPRGNLNIGLSINPQTAYESGRGRMRNIGPLMAALITKIGIIGLLVFKGLVLLVGKALIVSKVALILALIIGFKKLLSKKHVTYEVVSHPHHVESHAGHHDSYSSGWGRALDGFLEGLEATNLPLPDAQSQAYSAQQNTAS
ncbi:hypothetical protein HA402_010493 [Bradysia odoriphaga]|nr:hypothetical protein HA402_010493 [Bradysia odoriphaga]